MMDINIEICNGCGVCLEVCPVEAIILKAGKAEIDADTCQACGSCVQACPEGAISEVRLVVPVAKPAIQPAKVQTATPVLVSSSEGRFAWAKPVLSFIGHEIAPRLAEAFVAALDRRLSASPKTQVTFDPGTVRQTNGGRRPLRRRHRWRKYAQHWNG